MLKKCQHNVEEPTARWGSHALISHTVQWYWREGSPSRGIPNRGVLNRGVPSNCKLIHLTCSRSQQHGSRTGRDCRRWEVWHRTSCHGRGCSGHVYRMSTLDMEHRVLWPLYPLVCVCVQMWISNLRANAIQHNTMQLAQDSNFSKKKWAASSGTWTMQWHSAF